MKNFVTRGVNVIGGCCGTTPEHIRELGKTISDLKTVEIPDKTQNSGVIVTKQAESHTAICSGRNVIPIINWRLWPTIICTDLDELIDEIYDCLEDEPEAIIIDLSQFDSIDEQEADSVLSDIQMAASQPLAFISDKRQVQEAICRYYHGLSLIITDQETADLPAIIVRKE
jgi:5-methyltetrahydrofolate--homocysteine methyltransferase